MLQYQITLKSQRIKTQVYFLLLPHAHHGLAEGSASSSVHAETQVDKAASMWKCYENVLRYGRRWEKGSKSHIASFQFPFGTDTRHSVHFALAQASHMAIPSTTETSKCNTNLCLGAQLEIFAEPPLQQTYVPKSEFCRSTLIWP